MNDRIANETASLEGQLNDGINVFVDSDSSFQPETGSRNKFEILGLSQIDVLGLDSETNGRNCNQHECCGHHVRIKDVLFTSWQLQAIDREVSIPFDYSELLKDPKRKYPPTRAYKNPKIKNKKFKSNNDDAQDDMLFEDSGTDDEGPLEEVVKVFKIERDGMANCHVGYLPRRLFKKHGAKQFDGIFLRVVSDLRTSENTAERARSHRNYGMMTCDIIKDNPNYHGKNPLEGIPCVRLSDSDSVNSEITETSDTKLKTTKEERKKYSRRNNAYR